MESKYSEYTIENWDDYIINRINRLLSKFNIVVLPEDYNQPLTGEKIRFSNIELQYLYHDICENLGIELIISDDIMCFYTIRSISTFLHDYFQKTNELK